MFNLIWIYSIVLVSLILIYFLIPGKKKLNQSLKFIEEYHFPQQTLDKWNRDFPNMDEQSKQYVQQALKDFFIIYAKNQTQSFDMPSKIVDDLWHQFILNSKEYHEFCQNAFGKYLHHHQHDESDKTDLRDIFLSSNLINTYKYSSQKNYKGLPLLFACDELVNYPQGFLYSSENIQKQINESNKIKSNSTSSCGTSIIDSGGDGFGCSSSVADTSSCSSSCGGGGCGGN